MTSAFLILIITLPWLGSLCILMIGDKHENIEHLLAVCFSCLGSFISIFLLLHANKDLGLAFSTHTIFGIFSFVPDGLGTLLAVIANCIGCLAIIFSIDYMHNEKDIARYYAMILFFIGAMSGLVLTNNILLTFFFWEITALCSYQLISFFNDNPKSVRGGLTALFITQFGGLGLLLCAILIYAGTGSLEISNFISAAQAGEISRILLTSAAFGCIAAAAAKSSQFPFNTWLPDAMEAPTPVSALIHAATMVNAGVYLLARFYPAFEQIPGWKMTIIVIGLITILLTSFMAIYSIDLKRVLAYSTVSQLGFLFVSIGAGSVTASIFHLMSHSIFKALLFLCAGSIIHSCGTRDMRLMGGLYKKMPVVGTCFLIGAGALAGIPIFNGFWSKETILEAVYKGCPQWVYLLMVFAVMLTAIYTIRCFYLTFMGETRSAIFSHDAGKYMRFSLILLAIGTLTSWLLFGKFTHLLSNSMKFSDTVPETTQELIQSILGDRLTFLAVGMVLIGFAIFIFRKKFSSIEHIFSPLKKASINDFGMESLNTNIVKGIQNAGELVRNTQTGYLNWNIFGVLLGLILIFIILYVGGR